MDTKLVAWAHAVKARHPRALPPLWLFSDDRRIPDLFAAVMHLPPGLAGVVFRDDPAGHDPAERAARARRLATLCRRRRLLLSVAGLTKLPRRLGAGRHLRAGSGAGSGAAFLTSSAHDAGQVRQARRAGAVLIFVSPVFPTSSHAGAAPLGPGRWRRLAASAGVRAAALGGIDGRTIRRLPQCCRHAGAIAALA